MTSLEETTKVKELEKIIVDTKEVDIINDKIELDNVNETTKIKVKDEGMIVTDEFSSIDTKDESRNGVDRDSNIHNKSRTKIIIHKEDTSTIGDIGIVFEGCIEEYFGSANNQTTKMLSSARDYVETKIIKYYIFWWQGRLRKGRNKDIEVDKINIKEVRGVWEKKVLEKEELKVNMGRYKLFIILRYFNRIGRGINTK